MLMEFSEKRIRLRRYPMPLAGQTMEPEIGFDGSQVGGESNRNALFFALPDVAAGGFAQAFKEPVKPWGEVEEVVGKGGESFGFR